MQIGTCLSFQGKQNRACFHSACLGEIAPLTSTRQMDGGPDGVSLAVTVGGLRLQLGATS